MTQQEQARLQVLNSVLAEHMTTEQAAEILGVSTRHTRRILAAYKEDGAAALAHGNRGRRPHNATSEMEEADVLYLSRTRYEGANHTHLSELLREREGIDIGRTTLRRILLSAGLSSPRRRRPPRHRVRRQRMSREGMLIQIDGSYHRWLKERCPQFTLLLAVDDATGSVVHTLFCQQEDTRGYFLLLDGLIQRRGIPLALYTDRHAVFKHIPGAGGVGAPTQFSRAMDELGIHLIFALSPQAKGRVERTAGTFQDRLVTELRLAGVSTSTGPIACSRTSCPASTSASGCRRSSRMLPFAHWRQTCAWIGPSASSTAEGWPGTTREVPLAYLAATARYGEAELCRSEGGGTGGAGGNSAGAARGAHYPYTGSAATSECPAELQRGFPAHSYPASGHQRRWQPSERQAGITRSGECRRAR